MDNKMNFYNIGAEMVDSLGIQGILFLWAAAVLVTFALTFKPLRKTAGLLLVILGAIACMTFIGLIVGIPMIIVGGLFLFV